MTIIDQDLKKYGNIPNRIIGQIWDSVGHSSVAITALAIALYPNGSMKQTIAQWILKTYATIYVPIQNHFVRAVDSFCDNLARTPALIFCSKTDKIATLEFAKKYAQQWRNNGTDVTLKCFPDSPHVRHYQAYSEDYLNSVKSHWRKVNLLERK